MLFGMNLEDKGVRAPGQKPRENEVLYLGGNYTEPKPASRKAGHVHREVLSNAFAPS